MAGPSVVVDASFGPVTWDVGNHYWIFKAGLLSGRMATVRYIPADKNRRFVESEWSEVRACIQWVCVSERPIKKYFLDALEKEPSFSQANHPVLFDTLLIRSTDAPLACSVFFDGFLSVRVDVKTRALSGPFLYSQEGQECDND